MRLIREYDILRALQYLYYVENVSVVSDYDFDMMEKAYEESTGQELPVGADLASDYTEAQRILALYLEKAYLL